MGPFRRCAVAVALIAAAACGNPSGPPAADHAVAAAAGDPQQLGVTTTAPPPAAPPTTGPASTTTTTRAVVTTTSRRPVVPPLPTITLDTTPAPPGTVPPSGPRTETGTTTSGSTTVSVTVGPLDQRPGQPVTITVALTTAEFAMVSIQMGDGTVEAVPRLGAECPPEATAVPVAAREHTYAAPGRYVIRAVVTVYPCTAGGPSLLPSIGVAPRTVEAAVNYQQR